MLMNSTNDYSHTEVVGLVPAGGKGERIAPLPCSKELYPIGFHNAKDDLGLRPKVISHYLLEKMRLANISKAFIILRKGKWDIPAYFGDGNILKMNLAYLMMDLPFGVPYTLDQAFPFVQDKLVAMGFPDVLLQPQNSFIQLLKKQAETNSDIILGLYPTDQPHKMDVVDFDENECIRQICPKPSKLKDDKVNYAWLTAVWTPVFTQYLHEFVSEHKKRNLGDCFEATTNSKRELFVGDVFQAAVADRLKIETVIFSDGNCLDIGTPDDLAKAVGKSF